MTRKPRLGRIRLTRSHGVVIAYNSRLKLYSQGSDPAEAAVMLKLAADNLRAYRKSQREDPDAAPELTEAFFSRAIYRDGFRPLDCGPDAPAAFKAWVDQHHDDEATELPSMDDIKAARREYGKHVDRFEGASFLAEFTTEDLIGPTEIISHNPTPETAAAIARMDAGQFTEIADTKAWLKDMGVTKP